MRIVVIIIIILSGCARNSDSHADYIHKHYSTFENTAKKVHPKDTLTYVYKGGEYKAVFEYNTAQDLNKLKGFFSDNPNPYGHYFDFDVVGKLDKYRYLTGDGKHDIHRITFSRSSGFYREEGNAFVDVMAPEEIKETANDYTLFFSTFPRENVEVSYSVDGYGFKELKIETSKWMPFLKEGNLMLDREQLKKGVVLRTIAKNLLFSMPGLNDATSYMDTLKL